MLRQNRVAHDHGGKRRLEGKPEREVPGHDYYRGWRKFKLLRIAKKAKFVAEDEQ